MNFLKNMLTGKTGADCHSKFVRYGKGEYERLLFEIAKGKNSFKVKSSFDFANDFVGIIADNIKDTASVSGKIIAPYDFKEEIEAICNVPAYSKRGKLFTAEISAELSPEQLRKIYDKFCQNFLLLNIKSPGFSLKVAKSLPKPGGSVKHDFCTAVMPLNLIDEFAWDVKHEFSKLIIKHVLNITDIVIPPELRNDPAKARLEAKRKGKIARIIEIDGKETRKETEFIA
ncbi:MAG: hypothetical protein PHO02_01615 [Candidatus Nanoarchaeia archaeon]|nr:hypothetical protein [Candidatus Nanoarchaeia archaeon]